MSENIHSIQSRPPGPSYQIIAERKDRRPGPGFTTISFLLCAILFLFGGDRIFSQTAGDYRTNGNTQFNLSTNWQVYNGAAWVAASTDPSLSSGVITIRNGHTATLTTSETLDQLVVEAGGTLRINTSRNLYLGNGAEPYDLDVYGTVDNYNNINTTANPGAAIRFNDNSVYNHRLNGGNIPAATWNITSTCYILSVSNTLPTGLNQVFGNFIWNCPAQTSDIDINADLNVAGTFTMANTGSRYLRIATSGSYTMNLGGYTHTGGRLNLAIGGFTCNFNLSGDFTFSGGNILTSGSGIGNINFIGPGIQNFDRTGGSISTTRIHYTVFNGAVLNMGTSIIDVSGPYVADGTFTLNDGGGLMLGDPYGITNSTTGATGGNIQVLGARTFSQNADYTYNGSVSQVTGDALPGTVRNFTVDNPTDVTLTGDLTVTGLLTMTQGNIVSTGRSFVLANSSANALVYNSGTVVGGLERYVSQTSQGYLFPVGSSVNTQSLNINFTNLTAGSLLVDFISSDPGNAGLPLIDAGSYTITNQYTTGYWTAQAKNSLATLDYSIDLDATGFGPYAVTAGTRIIRRNATADWSLDGIHAGVTGSTVSRTDMTNGISGGSDGTHFCIGKTGPVITSQPVDNTVCQGSTDLSVFSVVASGYGALTYQWYRYPDDVLTDDGHFSGTATPALGITNAVPADAGAYYCTITDGRGESISTSTVYLNVPTVTFGFEYYADLTIDQASGTEDLDDFPVLVNITEDYLRTTANGGHVQNINGYDILFVDNNNEKLNFEVESYDPVTGNIIAWVRVPVLSSGGTTSIRLVYGNPDISTDQSTEETWISSYKGVWHLSNNSFLDATAFDNDLANNGSTDIDGLIDEARDFDGSNDNLRTLTTTGFGGNGYNQTISLWARFSGTPASTENLVVLQRAGSTSAVQLGFRSVSGTMRVVVWNWGGAPLLWSDDLPSENEWHYYTYTFDGFNHRLYIDGAEAATSTTPASQNALPQFLYLGSYSGGEYFDGIIDEARYSLSYKAPGWIATEYSNQIDPENFVYAGEEFEMSFLTSAGVCNSPLSLTGYPAGGTFTGTGVTGSSFDPAVAGPGVHTITYTNNVDGCNVSIAKDITVSPLPSAPESEDAFCCLRNVADLEASGSNLTWYSNPGLTTIVGWGTPFATGLTSTGTFTFYVTQTVNGCESEATPVTLTIYPNNPVGGTASVSRDPECIGNTAVFTVTGYTGSVIGWQKKLVTDTEWTDIPSSDSNPYSEVLLVAGNWHYRAVVSVGMCGSAYSSVVNLTVEADVTPPVVAGCPSDITVYTGAGSTDCSQIVSWTEPTAEDYCQGTVNYSSRSHAPGSSFPVGTTTVTYTFTDGTNPTSCIFNVNVVDNTPPEITCAIPASTYDSDAGECYYTVPGSALDPTSTGDNCAVQAVVNDFNGSSTLAGARFPVGTTTVIWTVTDIHGNDTQCQYDVVVSDNEDPSITCAAPAPEYASDAGECYYTVSGTALDPASAGDNCAIQTVVNDFNGTSTLAGARFPVGTTTVIWTVTDIHGNDTQCQYDVVVSDNEDPSVTCATPAPDYDSDAGECYYTVPGAALDPTSAGDNCAVQAVVNDFNGTSTLAGARFPVGTTTVIWTVTDIHGNDTHCQYDVVVSDNEDPSITCPADIAGIPADEGECHATGVDIGTAITDDNCGVASVTSNAPAQFPVGTTTVTWTVTDIHGNTATCEQQVTVIDSEAPSFTAPGDITIYKDGSCNYNASVSITGDVIDESDNCDTSLDATYTDVVVAGSCEGEEVITRTWSLTDDYLNTTTHVQVINIRDNTPPAFTVPADITIYKDGTCNYDASVLITGDVIDESDNCDTSLDATYTDVVVAGSCEGEEIITRTWLLTDDCGNSTTHIQVITVRDTTPPSFTVPADITIYKDGTCNYDASVLITGDVIDESDNCDTSLDATYTDVVVAGSCEGEEIITRTWLLTDDCGNSTSHIQVITITDNTSPVWTTLAGALDVILECDDTDGLAAAQALFPVATDNCDTNTSDIVKTPGIFNPGVTCPQAGTYINTWKVTDECGNESTTYTQTITLVDITPPAFTVPADITIYKDVTCNYDASVGITGDVSDESDNCDTSLDATYSDVVVAGSCEGEEIITRTWLLTDDCGNSTTHVQVITVRDTTPPSFTAPADITIYKDGTCNYDASVGITGDVSDESDNCDTSLDATYSDVVVAGSCEGEEIITRTWLLTDDCGNSTTHVQVITVRDTTPPAFTAPADITIYKDGTCNYDASVGITGDVSDESDNCDTSLDATYSDVVVAGSCEGEEIITRTWLLTDDCGNSTTHVQVITVRDTTPPTFTAPADITIYKDGTCNYDASVGITGDVIDESDNCDTSLDATYSDVVVAGSCEGEEIITRTWLLTDDCGNSTTHIQVITVRDTTPPAFTVPADITIYKDGTCNYDASVGITGDVSDESDNCDTSLDATYSDVVVAGSCEGEEIITRTWLLTDDCGNSTTHVQVITVRDTTPPTFTAPADITIYKDGTCNYDASVGITGDVSDESDNCDTSLDATYSDVVVAGSCEGEEIITRTWLLTDDCGNSTTHIQVITVRDTTPPSFTVPADITIYKDVTCNYDASVLITGDVIDESDNCDTSLDATYSDVVVAGSCEGEEIITRTWLLTDDCGNSTTHIQVITVRDTTPPTFTVPADITIYKDGTCNYDASVGVTGDVSDESDNCDTSLDATYSDVVVAGSCEGEEIITRTWLLTDDCGNSTTHIQVITVRDTTPPTFTAPADITIYKDGTCNYDASVGITGDVSDESDNCDTSLDATYSDVVVAGSCEGEEIITRTWLLTDDCGNSTTHVQVITVRDTTPPTFTAPADITIYKDGTCNYDASVGITGDVSDESDNCDTSLDATYSDVVVAGSCEGEEIITRTWLLTDDCGNSTTHVQVITVRDTTPPTFTAPADITIYKDGTCNYDASVGITGDVSDESDNCDTSLDATYSDVVVAGSCEGEEIITRTWLLTDDCGNSTTHIQVITVRDTTPPSFTVPADITIYKDVTCNYDASVLITGDVIDESDNCDTSLDATYSDVVVAGSCEGEEIITRTWLLTDDCGNSTTHIQVITVRDTTPPAFTVPADITIYKDGTCNYDASVGITGDVSDESDNCDTSLDATYSDVVVAGSCEGEEIITRTWLLTDDCGNSTTHVQVITVRDTTPPTFTAPADITIYKDGTCNYDASVGITGDVSDESDNCDTSLDAMYSDVVVAGSCEGEEIITRTWLLTDDCGNSTTHIQVITVRDTTPPTFTVPADITIYKDVTCNYDASVGITGDVSDESDNCDTSLDATYSDVVVAGSCEGEEIITRTWLLTDDCGNSTTHIQVITVRDTTPPAFTVPADITIYKDGTCNYDASVGVTGDVSDESDNCDTSLDATYSDVVVAGSCEGEEIITRTWLLTDDCGNSTTHIQVITVRDTTPPSFTVPADITIYKDGTCNYDASVGITGDVSDESDNCDTSLDATYSDVVVAGSCEGEEIITRTWLLTDDCGNSTTHIQVITVRDTTPPAFTAPADITIYKDGTCNYDASVGITGDVIDESDNCDTSLDATYTDVVVAGSCEGEEIITRTWLLTDDCGNSTTHVQVITVRDTTPPTFTAPADITIYKDGSCNYDASVGITGDVSDESDNCDTSLDATYSDVVVAGSCEGEEIITRTWLLTDDCGNSTTHVQVITVRDTTPPTFTAPADITIYKDGSCNYDASVGITGDVSDESDNCDTSLDATYSDVVVAGSCEGEEIITRTWLLTDDCGNSTTHVQVITVRDTTPPTFTAPADITIYKDGTCNYDASVGITGDVSDESDNCDTSLDATYSDVVVAGSCEGEEIITRTWLLTDDCGNSTTHIQVITVRDTTPPSFTVPADITIYKDVTCNYDASVGITGDVSDESDNCDTSLDATYTDVVVAGSCEGEEIITRTWLLTDDCGNSTTHIQVITVRDTTPPAFTALADITIYKDGTCNYDASVLITGDVIDESDNCDTSLDATYSDVVVAGSCEGEEIITRTWLLTDDCGNSTTHVQVITVRDTTPPTFTAPADITIYKDGSCNYDASVGITGDVSDESDNCDTSLDATYSDVVVAGSCEGEEIITRTWLLTDDCGNSTTHVQVITVRDTTPPAFTVPADITIYKDGTCNYDASVGITGDVSDESDNCDTSLDATYSDVVVAGSCEGEEIITRTWLLTDDCGNSTTHVQVITVRDTTPPTFTAPADITIYKDGTCNYDASVGITGDVSDESDNCDTSLDATYSDVVVAGSCEGEEIITRTWLLTDDCGNSTTHVQVITVRDTTPPTFTAPADITIYKDGTCNYDASVGITGDVSDESDNCDTSLDATYSDVVVAGSCEGEEIITRTWLLTDDCGNSTTHIQVITVRDTTPPAFTVPADITIYKDGTCNYDASVGITGDVSDESDNCDTSLDATYSDVVVAGSCEGEEIITRTWLLTDDCGNSTTHVQVITVRDTTPPTFTAPADITIYKDGTCNYDASVGITGDVSDESDNCDTSLDATYSDVVVAGSCEGEEIITRTWLLTDDCGNSTTHIQVITVRDTTPPSFTVPADITIYKDVTCNYDASVLITGDVIDESDNCDTSLDATYSDVVVAGSCEGEEIITRTWLLTDDCGNSTTHIQVITVRDTTPPTFTVPADITIYKDGTCNYDASVGVTGDVSDESDNCDTSLDATYSDVVVAGSCEGEEIITRTWLLTDDCGNSTTHIQVITVRDTTPPTFTAPADITIYKDGTCNYDASVGITGDVSDESDNCDTSLDATYSDVVVAGSCEGEEIITRTWLLTDDCGNSTTHVQVITVRDTTPPTFTAPADITIYKDGTCNYDASVGITGDVSDESDNCDTSLDATYSDVVVAGSCEGEEIITRTWLLTDDCGNSTTHVQVITVRDTTPPTFTAPADITIYKDGTCNYDASVGITGDVSDESDNCDTSLDATYSDVVVAGSCEGEEIITRTWLLTDDCGNSTTHIQVITVRDTTPPSFTVPADITIYKDVTCNYDASVLITGDVIDESDNCDTSLDATYSDVVVAGSCEGEEIITRTWLLTDDCGNSTTHIQVITVRDTTPPAFTVPADITIYKDGTCNYDASVGITGDVSDESDNCDTSLDATYSDVVVAGSCEGEEIITRTWLLTDDCGNSTTHVQVITVRDTTPPTFTAPADITIYKDGTCNYDASVGITGDVIDESDNCDTSLDATYSDVVVAGSCEGEEIITRTWLLTDDCGNSTTHIQVITVRDTTPPAFTAPADITIYKDGTCNYDASVGITGDVSDESDNCDTSLDATYSDVVVAGSCEGEEIITRTWLLTDDCGNSTTHVQVITVRDTTPPTFTAPADITIYKDGTCNYDASVGITGDVSDESDNCDTSLDATYSDVVVAGSCEGEEIITRTWLLTDDCGNSTTHIQVITVRDTTPPAFTVPADITICRDIDGSYDRSVSNTGDVTDESDNCDTSLDALYTDSDADMGTVTLVGYITRTWTLTDDCGNVTTQQQIIWVQPVPRISVEVQDTLVCNGTIVDFTIDSLVVSGGEVMYDLDVTYPAGISGTLSDGSNQIVDISDQLINSTDSYQSVTYTFRPYIQGKPGDPACMSGINITIVIHVEPTARVSHILADDELCNGENVNIQLSTVTVPYIGIEFNVDAINGNPEISGFTDRTGLVVTDIITEPLTNSGDTARMVLYVISPVTLDIDGNQKCFGINDTVEVWVNPTPRVVPVNYTPQICDEGTTNIVLTSPTVTTSGFREYDYTISATASVAIVGGNRAPAINQPDNTQLQFQYTNESDTMQSVFFHIIPRINGLGCPDGDEVASEVMVHARPLQSLEILDSITCDGGQDGALEVIPARGMDPLWVAWTGPDYWEDAGYNMFIATERSQGYYTATVTDDLGCVSSDWLNLMEPNTEVAFYFDSFISCPGAGDARAGLALTEGQAPPYYYYLIWNETDTVYQGLMPPEDTFFYLPDLRPGEYHLIVEDVNGCKKELLRTLYDAPGVTAEFEKSWFGEHNVSCESYDDGQIRVSRIRSFYMDGTDTVFVTTRAPYMYQWTASDGGVITGSSTDSILVNIPAGTYTLTVTDNLGCVFYFTDVLTEPDGIDLLTEAISASADGNYQISCFGTNDGYINLQFDGGSGDYSYAWTGPGGYNATTASIAGLTAGTYDLTVTDANMCHRMYSYVLNEPDSIAVDVVRSLTYDGAYNIGCNGGDGTIDVTVSGGSGTGTYTYNWTSPDFPEWSSGVEDLTRVAGIYRLSVTDVNGCINNRVITLTQPEPQSLSLDVSAITCLNAPAYNDGAIDLTISGGRAPYVYSWEGPSGYTSGLEDISGLTEGDYAVTVTDDYGCMITADTLMILPEPITLSFLTPDYNGFGISCLGRTDGWLKVIPQSGTAPYVYSWSGPDGYVTLGTDSIYNLSQGTYYVTATDRNLCTITQEATLGSPGQLSMTLNIGMSNGGGYNINCNGAVTGMVDITPVNAAGISTYLWSDGLSGASRDDLGAGLHEVILTDGNGCMADTSFILSQPDSLLIDFSMVSPYCPESSDGSIFAGVKGGEGTYSFTWSNGQTTQEAEGLVAGLYIVEAMDFNGCIVKDSLYLNALNEICVGIPNAFSPDGDGINEYWNITRIAFYTEAEVIILNRWGEMVWKSEKGYPEPWDGRASNGKELPMDSYHYAIDLHNGDKPIVGHVTIIRQI